jgi:hypothetical protein
MNNLAGGGGGRIEVVQSGGRIRLHSLVTYLNDTTINKCTLNVENTLAQGVRGFEMLYMGQGTHSSASFVSFK